MPHSPSSPESASNQVFQNIRCYLSKQVIRRLRIRFRLFAKDAVRSPLKYVRLAFIGLILFYVMFGDYGFITRVRLEIEKARLSAQLSETARRSQMLREEIQNMHRLEEIERWAREKYHLSAPGETVYVIK
ncbi:MAG: FtsB family cell division protein [Candidatus Thermochlorobacter sp.]